MRKQQKEVKRTRLIQFFSNTKNAKKENSIVLEVRKTIEKHKEEMAMLRDKLKKLREIV